MHQLNINSKKKTIASFASLVFGVLSVGVVLLIELLRVIAPIMELGPFVNFLFLQIRPLFGLIGLFLGMIGLKSTKRNFAIAGIILCLIGLLIPLYYFRK